MNEKKSEKETGTGARGGERGRELRGGRDEKKRNRELNANATDIIPGRLCLYELRNRAGSRVYTVWTIKTGTPGYISSFLMNI